MQMIHTHFSASKEGCKLTSLGSGVACIFLEIKYISKKIEIITINFHL